MAHTTQNSWEKKKRDCSTHCCSGSRQGLPLHTPTHLQPALSPKPPLLPHCLLSLPPSHSGWPAIQVSPLWQAGPGPLLAALPAGPGALLLHEGLPRCQLPHKVLPSDTVPFWPPELEQMQHFKYYTQYLIITHWRSLMSRSSNETHVCIQDNKQNITLLPRITFLSALLLSGFAAPKIRFSFYEGCFSFAWSYCKGPPSPNSPIEIISKFKLKDCKHFYF